MTRPRPQPGRRGSRAAPAARRRRGPRGPAAARRALALRACLASLLVAVAAAPQVAAAAEHRFAVVIGADRGEQDESPLRFAERDARRFADVLRTLGGVRAERLQLVRGGRRDAVQAAFATAKRSIAAARVSDPGGRFLLVVFYSGHASVRALHLDGTQLTFAELRHAGKAAGADVAVFMVDACRSGGLTRVKGAVPAQPFQIRAADHLSSRGTAMISSAALGEDAQESDRLAGGIFTHHVVAGLLGAADSSGDGRVTLDEVYRYAYSQTVRTTSRTRFVQHPTYAFRMKGRRAVVLTRLAAQRDLGRVQLQRGGTWVLARQGGDGVTEVRTQAGAVLVVPRGRYLVRRRERAGLLEGRVEVGPGLTRVADAQLRRVPYGSTVRRGGAAPLALRFGTAVEATSAPLEAFRGGVHGALGLQLDLTGVSLQGRMRYGRADAVSGLVRQDMLGADLSALRVMDWARARLSFGLGLRAGGEWWWQRFTDTATDRGQWVWRVGPLARVTWAPWARVAIAAECALNVHGLELEGQGWQSRTVPACGLGVAWYVR